MIVEDQLLLANDMKMQLLQLDYEIVGIVTRVNLALEFLEKEKNNSKKFPDVILTDISLPGKMSGIDLGRILNDMYSVAVIYISGLGQLDLIEEILRIKPQVFLLKPFDVYFAHMHIQMAMRQLTLEKENKRLKEGIRHLSSLISE